MIGVGDLERLADLVGSQAFDVAHSEYDLLGRGQAFDGCCDLDPDLPYLHLLDGGVDVNGKNGSGRTALSGAAFNGNLRTLRALLAAGVGKGGAAFIGMIAVILASINVVGGFLVTNRMLLMFQKKK